MGVEGWRWGVRAGRDCVNDEDVKERGSSGVRVSEVMVTGRQNWVGVLRKVPNAAWRACEAVGGG